MKIRMWLNGREFGEQCGIRMIFLVDFDRHFIYGYRNALKAVFSIL